MTVIIAEVYEAFREVGISEKKAAAASLALADYNRRIHSVRQKVSVLNTKINILLLLACLAVIEPSIKYINILF